MKKIGEYIMLLGGILILLGAVLFITGWEPASFMFSVGTIMFSTVQIADRYKGDNFLIKRLRFQQILGAAFLLISGFLMISAGPLHLYLLERASSENVINGFLLALTAKNVWIVTLTIAAIFELYSSYRIDNIRSKIDEII